MSWTSGDEHEEETRLIARCQSGDQTAFRHLVERYQQYVFAVAFRVVCDEDHARDVVQETFIRVWRNLKSFDPGRRFTTWLFRIAVNLAYDHMRSEHQRKRMFLQVTATGDHPAYADPDDLADVISNKDLTDRIRRLTAQMSPKQRIVFVLRDLEELPMEEIAETLGMSMASVKTSLCYARKKMRAYLGPLVD